MRVNLILSILVFQEKNIVHITMRVNLIHSKLILKKMLKKLTNWKKKNCSREQCMKSRNSLLFFHYHTAANCVLIKTQPQPRKQTASKSIIYGLYIMIKLIVPSF
jgi:hypothetical protein